MTLMLPLLLLSLFLVAGHSVHGAANVGVCWGRDSWQPLPPKVVVKLLQDNGIQRLKLFGADSDIMLALVGSDIEVSAMVANEYLQVLALSPQGAQTWLNRNIAPYMFTGGVNIKYIAVGNEPFLSSYGGRYNSLVMPALQNLQGALQEKHLDSMIKLVVPLNLDILSNSYPPSQAQLRPDIKPEVMAIIQFLDQTTAPFSVNIYPFLTLHQQPMSSPLPLSQILIDDYNISSGSIVPPGSYVDSGSNLRYTNIFDGSYDAMITVFKGLGYPNMEVVVGEVGWPSDGEGDTQGYASLNLAQRFNNDIIRHMVSGKGTPLRPNVVINGYLFSLLDEDNKGVGPGNFERHWGIFLKNGMPKYSLDLTGTGIQNATLVAAQDVPFLPRQWCIAKTNATTDELFHALNYVCGTPTSDCTAIRVGGSCYSKDNLKVMASYAMNTYYQLQDQNPVACDFGGIGEISTTDPSMGNCTFTLGVQNVKGALAISPFAGIATTATIWTVIAVFLLM